MRGFSWLSLSSTAVLAVAIAGCGSSSSTTATNGTGPGGAPPAAPGGSAPGGGASSGTTYTPAGAFVVSGKTQTAVGKRYVTAATNQSGVLATKKAVLTLQMPTVSTTGSSKSSDQSSFVGLDAGVLVNSGSKAVIVGGSITTTGDGANGVFASGTGSSATLSGTRITASGQYAHGAMAAGGGSVKLAGVTINTAGASSAAVATDRGGGTITSVRGTWTTSGKKSPAIYSTGKVTVSGATAKATGSEGAVIEGANSIVVNNTTLKGCVDRGVMLYQSMSGDANAGTGRYTMNGGSLTAVKGPGFYVTNTNAAIQLTGGAQVTAKSGVLLKADAAGTGSGNTGPGNVTFGAVGEQLTGDLIADSKSAIAATLASSSSLKGGVTNASLILGSGSSWNVTKNSTLRVLTGAAISGTKITNITGNGHTVTYDAAAATNSRLGKRTYTLSGGGTLKPA